MRNKLMFFNTVAVMITTVLNIALGMVQIRAMLFRYGSTINGLVQTSSQLTGYISLLEAGICASFLYSMYKPVAEKDYESLSSIYVGFSKSIKKIVFKMIIVTCIVAMIYPILLKKDGLSYGYMCSILMLIGLKMIMPYLVTLVPKYMIIIQEQRYKIELISGFTTATTYVIQIILLYTVAIPLQMVLLICIVIETLSGIVYLKIMKSLYGKKLNKKAIPDYAPRKMSNDVMVHTISRLVFNSTDNIVISALSSLNAVTIYSNYNLIVQQVSKVFQSIFDGAAASMGVKIANNDKNSYFVYRELLVGALFIGSIITSVFVVMINPFIDIWVGSNYRLSKICCILFGYIMYSGIIFPCLSVARNAKGLYKESKLFTIVQSVVNLAITIMLVPKFGIIGALIGTFLARLLITIPFNYNLIDKKVFPDKKSRMIELVGCIFISGVSIIIDEAIIQQSSYLAFENIVVEFIIKTCVCSLVSIVLAFIYFGITDKGFKRLLKRIFSLIKNNKSN